MQLEVSSLLCKSIEFEAELCHIYIYIYIYKITTINFDKMKETDAIEIRGYVRKTPRNVRILCTN